MSDVDTMPVMPAATGDAYADSRARHAHFANLTAYIEKRGPGAPVAAAPVPVHEGDNLAAFDAEMRAKGLQRSDTAPNVLEARVEQIRGEYPGLNATTASKAAWEQRLAVAMAELQGAVPVAAAPVQPPAQSEDGFVASTSIDPDSLSGYTIPADLQHLDVHAGVLAENLAAARAAGISQEQVAAVMRELAKAAA